ncbi:MAG: ATP-dependent DNA helicase [Clostridiales bacterium]|jgi:Rad3-related DNA helicase|nr:ATP-dependent DNA helicase [Clostridiales bacterium]
MKISVRDIVELVLRGGNLTPGMPGGLKRAQEGARLHRALQKGRVDQAERDGYKYEKEVTLRMLVNYKDISFNLEGRADGLIESSSGFSIEEIKSVERGPDGLPEDVRRRHWAQAKCYAYMFCLLNGLDEIMVIITYIQCESGELDSFEEICDRAALEDFFNELLEKYYQFAKLEVQRVAARNETAAALAFPYPSYRPNQRQYAVAVYSAIKNSRMLFAQAPTGTGKTISVLFPAVKALAQGLSSKIFYLTARTVTRRVAENALRVMEGAGLRMRSLTITAKEKICPCPAALCLPSECERAAGHFDRVNAAVLDIVSRETIITREVLETYAAKHMVCPHEFSLDVALFCDCVICDYNYVYDPKVQLKRFFSEGAKTDFVILTDEAHNLVDRAREMFSATLGRADFLTVLKRFKGWNTGLYRCAGKLAGYFRAKGGEPFETLDGVPAELQMLLEEFTRLAEEPLQNMAWNADRETYTLFSDVYFKALDFLRVAGQFDERYAAYRERDKAVIRLLCLDPSRMLGLTRKKARAAVFFSATLTPLTYFRDVFGGSDQDYAISLPSPFPSGNFCLIIEDRISTRYKDRDGSAGDIARLIFETTAVKPGNYLVFFPSYAYLERIFNEFAGRYPNARVFIQAPEMTERERDEFLSRFDSAASETILAFAVMGGVFSEGIDLTGDRLVGACVVGVGLPLITFERGLIAGYYARLGLDGFDYAYTFPGMNKVMQAVGRVIRSETDRGIALLIDSRFTYSKYINMFPPEWRHYRVARGSSALGIAGRFWDTGQRDV